MSERTIFQAMSRRHVLSLAPTASVHEAACVMTRANCGSVLIIDATSQQDAGHRDRARPDDKRVLAKAQDPTR
jgi:CBS domain-containing protein